VLYNLCSEEFSFRDTRHRRMAPVISRSIHRNLVGVRTVDVASFWKHVISASSTDPTGHKEECTLQTVRVFMPYFVFYPAPHVSQLQLRYIHLLLSAESVDDLQLPAP